MHPADVHGRFNNARKVVFGVLLGLQYLVGDLFSQGAPILDVVRGVSARASAGRRPRSSFAACSRACRGMASTRLELAIARVRARGAHQFRLIMIRVPSTS